jgi:hypothetical protein
MLAVQHEQRCPDVTSILKVVNFFGAQPLRQQVQSAAQKDCGAESRLE